MNYLACIGLIIVGLVIEGESNDLEPGTFRTCPRSMPNYSQCLVRAVNDAVISLGPGLRSFDIPPLEPLEIESVGIGATEGVVSLRQNYRNVKLYGLTKGFRIFNYDIDFDNLIFRSNSINEQVDFVADYTIQGRILLLPISGSGRSNVTMLGLKAKNTMYCEKYDKNGETYLRVTKYDIKFTPDKVLLDFSNLFNGDAALSQQMNNFLNLNSDVVFRETQAAYEETFGLVFTQIANNILSRIPFHAMFPN